MRKRWFFTGQNITAKKQESKANLEFITANRTNLPTLQEAIKIYEQYRQELSGAHKTKSNTAIGKEMKRESEFVCTDDEFDRRKMY